MTIELGSYCKDMITGIEGHAVMRVKHVTGCDRYTLQPRIIGELDGKTIPESFDFDENRLTVDPEKSMGGFEDFDGDEPDIKLGMYVIDNITGFKGYVIMRVEDLAGRVRFGIQATANLKENQKDSPPYHYTDWRRLEDASDDQHPHLVIPGITDTVESEKTESKDKKKKSSGKGADTLMGRCPL